MKLKSPHTYWLARNGRGDDYPSLTGNVTCEVAILGAGLTGALLAHRLAQDGTDIVVLDKRSVAAGSTSASTALVLYDVDTPLTRLIDMRGRAKAVRSYQCCREAVFLLEATAKQLATSCDFRRQQSLQVASKRAHVDSLRAEWDCRRRHGFDVAFLDADQLRDEFGLAGLAVLITPDAAVLDPYKFATELMRAAVKLGTRIFTDTPVVGWSCQRGWVTVRTANNQTVTARHLVVAAGYESQAFMSRRLIRLRSTYVATTRPVRGLPDNLRKSVVWETARPYHYLRSTPDDRLMIGGLDDDFAGADEAEKALPGKAQKLVAQIGRWFPGLHPRGHSSWFGVFGETEDGLPFVGAANGEPRVLYALCYGANGTNFGMMAARIISDRLAGRKNRDGKLFALDR